MNLKKICDSYFCTHEMDKQITFNLEYEVFEILDYKDSKTGRNMLLFQLKPFGCRIIRTKREENPES